MSNASFDTFARSLAEAYEHLYDIVYLRTHRVTPLLRSVRTTQGGQQEPAWQVHHLLIEAIHQLNPEGRAPTLSKAWRKHRLMLLRYVEGLLPQEVADALSISRRQFYRVQEEALHTLAEMLWPAALLQAAQHEAAEPSAHRYDLLKTEVERHKREHKLTHLGHVVESALSLLGARLAQHDVQTLLRVPETLPTLEMDEKLFRQLLLGIIDYLVERTHDAALEIVAQANSSEVRLTVCMRPALTLSASTWGHTEGQLSAFKELAALNRVQLDLLREGETLHGFELQRPVQSVFEAAHPNVLVVDDNADILELYRRYLAPHGIHVFTAQHARAVFDFLQETQPNLIFLDLMLPDQDGWDILQRLQSHPNTRMIPVVICSVLKQRELALSLGAAQFMEKPFTPATLLTALEVILKTPPG